MNFPQKDEAAWIEYIRLLWGPSGAEVGPGDDACVLPPERWAVSTDALLQGYDFELRWAPPQAIGFKALAANLSDLAAMGAEPRHLLLTLGWPPGIGDAYIEGVLEGMRDLALREGVSLAGGDLTRAPGLLLSLTVFGIQNHPPPLRSGGRPGDSLYVAGSLGGPAAALARFREGAILETFDPGAAPENASQRELDRFFRPPSQTTLGQFLAARRLATCCMDLSDGLSRDLERLCRASSCGAEIDESALPLDPSLGALSPPETLAKALAGGEEQVLLFASDPARSRELAEAPGALHRIGGLRREGGIDLLRTGGGREPLPQGFDHFLP